MLNGDPITHTEAAHFARAARRWEERIRSLLPAYVRPFATSERIADVEADLAADRDALSTVQDWEIADAIDEQ